MDSPVLPPVQPEQTPPVVPVVQTPASSTIPPAAPSRNTPTNQERFDYWVKVIIGLCILIIAFDLSFIALSPVLLNKKTTIRNPSVPIPSIPAMISGTLDINGPIPENAILEIQQRRMGDDEFAVAVAVPSVRDTMSWNWNTAEEGSVYELRASVVVDGVSIGQSNILAVTAPALNEELRIVLPKPVQEPTAAPQQSPTPGALQTTTISGRIGLNGYIPPVSFITIEAKKQGESGFKQVVGGLNASDGVSWSWNGAVSGITYEFQAVLNTPSGIAGVSPTLTTAAPSGGEMLVLHSTASAPAIQGSISGIFDINGPIPANATITLSARKSGTDRFEPIATGLPVSDGSAWNIPNLQSGVSYDILAYLQVNGSVQTQSQLLVTPAPAHDERLTINIANRPGAPPSSSITFSCQGKNNSQWQVNIQYNQNNVNPTARSFILQLGSTSGNAELFSIQTTPTNPGQMQSYTSNFLLNEGQTYFAQYAYSPCQNCTDPAFYSLFAGPIQVRCVTSPTGTPSPIPTTTSTPVPTATQPPTPTATLTPTSTATPTPTPKISQCNESCGGNGYVCAEPLVCSQDGAAIGGGVCRNPQCPTESGCSCP